MEAKALLQKSMAYDSTTLFSIAFIGEIYDDNGFYTEAESDFKKALELAKTHNDQLAKALIYNNLAMTYLDMNKLKDAESTMNTSITEAASVLKDNSSNFIKLQINLANIYRFQKKYDKVLELLQNVEYSVAHLVSVFVYSCNFNAVKTASYELPEFSMVV